MFLCQSYLRPFFNVFKMERRGRYGGVVHKTRKEITHAFLMLPRSCLALVTRKKKGAFLVSYPNSWGANINQKGNKMIVDEDDGQGLHMTNLRILINYYSKALSSETHLHVRCKNLQKRKAERSIIILVYPLDFRSPFLPHRHPLAFLVMKTKGKNFFSILLQ